MLDLVKSQTNIVQAFYREQFDKELGDPDLRALEDPMAAGSTENTSVAPSTATETPQPTPGVPRIRLVSNSAASAGSNGAGGQVNGGGSSGMQSEDD